METLRNPALECACDFGFVAAAELVIDQALQQRTKIEFIAEQREWIRIGRGRVNRKALQTHCGLAFESHFTCESEQRGRGIKESSHRGGAERANVTVDELHSVAISRRERERASSEVNQLI